MAYYSINIYIPKSDYDKALTRAGYSAQIGPAIPYPMINGVQYKKFNTYSDFSLVPTSFPVLVSPTAKTNYIDIPGADGELDYTEALTTVKFGMRDGSFEFIKLHKGDTEDVTYTTPSQKLYNLLLNFFHGRMCLLELETEPDNYYKGRLTVSLSPDKSRDKFTIGYKVYPWPIDTNGKEQFVVII